MKQIFYIVAIVVLMILAHRVMAKVKDLPEGFPDFPEQDPDEDSEDFEIESEIADEDP